MTQELDLKALTQALRPYMAGSRFVPLEPEEQALLDYFETNWDFGGVYLNPDMPPLEAPPQVARPRPLVLKTRPEPEPGPVLPTVPTPTPSPSTPPPVPPPAQSFNKMEAKSLDSLHFRVRECRDCILSNTRRSVVFGQGNQQTKLLVVGDQPSQPEDQRGQAFFGAEGEWIDKIILALGINPRAVYYTQRVKCRPDGDRPATFEEIEACGEIFGKQIELLAPRLILALGERTLKSLLPQSPPWSEIRGRALDYQGARLIGLWHPRDVSQNLGLLPQVWDDLRRVRQELGPIFKMA